MRIKIFIIVILIIVLFVLPLLAGEIHDAARQGEIGKIKALLAKNPEAIALKDKDGKTALHFAAFTGRKKIVELLLAKGAEVNAKKVGGYTPLAGAVMYGHKEVAALLLEKGANIEAANNYKRTPLLLVARERGNFACAKLLIDKGADINAKDKFGATPIDLAAWRGFRPIVNLLIDKGAHIPTGIRSRNFLVFATSYRLIKLFKLLMAKDVNLDIKNGNGGTLLHNAAAGGSPEIMEILIKKGFKVNQKDRYLRTPLHYAAEKGREQAVDLLIKKGSLINARTSLGKTAFNIAEEWDYKEVSALLAEKGADQSPQKFPVLKGEYLGMKKPGLEPELFAKGIISEHLDHHGVTVFSPDGEEVYWSPSLPPRDSGYGRGVTMTMKVEKGRWTPPKFAPFSVPDYGDGEPFFSPDGKKLYILSMRPIPPKEKPGKENIWVMDKQGDGWSEPRPLDPVVNDFYMHWQFSVDKAGNLYFGGRGIHCARFVKGKYQKPEKIMDGLCPFITPDGDYLLFSAESKKNRSLDLFISFKQADGTWSQPRNLGEGINTGANDICPVVSPDGKYLFFISGRNGVEGVYWVDARIIDKLKI